MSEITVFYNGYNDFQTFTCDGDTSIYLDGNYIFTDSNYLFTPYLNIHYTDSDNQVLTGQYDKSELFLDGQYNKTYTGGIDNYWVFDPIISNTQGGTIFTPVFNVSGTTQTLDNDNVFNNFADNSLKVLLSNIPSYIQYVTIFFILLFLFGFIRRFKRKR